MNFWSSSVSCGLPSTLSFAGSCGLSSVSSLLSTHRFVLQKSSFSKIAGQFVGSVDALVEHRHRFGNGPHVVGHSRCWLPINNLFRKTRKSNFLFQLPLFLESMPSVNGFLSYFQREKLFPISTLCTLTPIFFAPPSWLVWVGWGC